MNQWQRKILNELMHLCNELGGNLDYTATCYDKLKDRQRGLMDCYNVIYGVLTDYPENDYREDDRANAEEAVKKLTELTKIIYPDRNGNTSLHL